MHCLFALRIGVCYVEFVKVVSNTAFERVTCSRAVLSLGRPVVLTSESQV